METVAGLLDCLVRTDSPVYIAVGCLLAFLTFAAAVCWPDREEREARRRGRRKTRKPEKPETQGQASPFSRCELNELMGYEFIRIRRYTPPIEPETDRVVPPFTADGDGKAGTPSNRIVPHESRRSKVRGIGTGGIRKMDAYREDEERSLNGQGKARREAAERLERNRLADERRREEEKGRGMSAAMMPADMEPLGEPDPSDALDADSLPDEDAGFNIHDEMERDSGLDWINHILSRETASQSVRNNTFRGGKDRGDSRQDIPDDFIPADAVTTEMPDGWEQEDYAWMDCRTVGRNSEEQPVMPSVEAINAMCYGLHGTPDGDSEEPEIKEWSSIEDCLRRLESKDCAGAELTMELMHDYSPQEEAEDDEALKELLEIARV